MMKYTHKNLKRFINNYEYKFTTGQYHCLDFGDDTVYDNKTYTFNIVMWFGFKLFLVCDCELLNHERSYTINKVIFIDRKFDVYQFDKFDDFIKFIPTLDIIEEVHTIK